MLNEYNLQNKEINADLLRVSIKPQEKEIIAPFAPMLQGQGTNQLSTINSKGAAINAITGEATIEKGTLKVFIDKYNELTAPLRPSTHKLLDICTIALTQQNNYKDSSGTLNTTVNIPLERYMDLCGKPLTKSAKNKARARVQEDLNTLYNISLEWTENTGRKGKDGKKQPPKDFAKMRICTAAAFKKGNIILSFSAPMAEYLINAYIMQYPIKLLQVDERNPNAYHIGKKLLIHNSNAHNQSKGTASLISIKKLLEAAPEIPTFEEVMATDRHIDKRIIEALEKALEPLPFVKWEYANSKGKPLTEEQLANLDYSTFIKLYIKFDVIDKETDTTDKGIN